MPVATGVINVVGAFALGFLLQVLLRPGTEPERGETLRLFLGTGVLGGFTTYSALATDTVLLLARDAPALAAGYAGATLVLGILATCAGIALADLIRRSQAT